MDLTSQIEEAVRKEINVLRLMLSNLRSEQNALINKNLIVLDQIIEERLDYLEVFEGLAFQVIAYVRTLADQLNIQLPFENEFTHDKAIDFLKEKISVENIELLSLLDQLESLFEEIDNQCNIINYFLQTTFTQRPAPLKVEQLKKIQLQVMDPEKEE